ncbi:alpha/beta hydrolase [Rhodococcus sp. DT1]
MSQAKTDTAPTPRRGAGPRMVGAIADAVARGYSALALTPVPGAFVVRAVFERDAKRLTAKLDEGAPETQFVGGLRYRDGDVDACLDVYSPTGATSALPTIVWVHGGAWIAGSRADYAGYYRRLADAGFTVVSVGYSLAPRHRYPAAVEQLADAQRYLLDHAEELHIDTERIVLAGDSAGAQLTAQLALAVTDPSYAARLGISPHFASGQVRGVVLNCGIYNVAALGGGSDLIRCGVEQAMWAYLGERKFAESEAARQMSTLDLVTANFPPTYITGGNGDPLTATQSRPFAERLTGLGVEVDSLFYPDGHEPELEHEYQFDLSTPDARDALARTIAFARKVTA